MRVRAWQNVLKAAYPDTKVLLGVRRTVAGVGVNAVARARRRW
jgi:hypothetical protein